jgi:hypothetical protein
MERQADDISHSGMPRTGLTSPDCPHNQEGTIRAPGTPPTPRDSRDARPRNPRTIAPEDLATLKYYLQSFRPPGACHAYRCRYRRVLA